nr:antitoxin VbhA family protein [uncultured Pseudomonas sp.]
MEKLSCTDTSESERQRRRAAVDYARASVALEGFKLSELDEASAQAFVNGELTLSELTEPDKYEREDGSRASPEAAAERSPKGEH